MAGVVDSLQQHSEAFPDCTVVVLAVVVGTAVAVAAGIGVVDNVVGAVAVVQLVGVPLVDEPLVVDEACAAAAAVGKVGQPNWEHSHCC